MPKKQTLSVEVLNPDQILYQGPAMAISAVNNTGKFDILVKHSHFISMIKKNLIVHINKKERKEFPDIHGVLRCVDDQVTIYLGIRSTAS